MRLLDELAVLEVLHRAPESWEPWRECGAVLLRGTRLTVQVTKQPACGGLRGAKAPPCCAGRGHCRAGGCHCCVVSCLYHCGGLSGVSASAPSLQDAGEARASRQAGGGGDAHQRSAQLRFLPRLAVSASAAAGEQLGARAAQGQSAVAGTLTRKHALAVGC